MPKLSSSTQTNRIHPISYRRAKKREIHEQVLHTCSASNSRAAPLCGAKRKASSLQKKTTPAPPDVVVVVDACCYSQIPTIWGAKRARSAAAVGGGGGDSQIPPISRGLLLLRSTQIPPPPIWGRKRARSTRTCCWRDWANLGDGPAGVIADLLLANDVADFVSFRAVCRPWRLCSMDPLAHGILDRRFHPHQWIMLKETLDGHLCHPHHLIVLRGTGTGGSPYCIQFLNVSTGCSRYVDLPELHGHDVFGPTTEGLLVLLDRTTYVVRLLNPFTRQAAKLPPATTLMSQDDLELIKYKRSLLWVSGAGLADDCTIAVHFQWIRTVAVIKPGDTHWIVVDRGTDFLPAMSFSGCFYCATYDAVMVVETSVDQPPRLTIAAKLIRPVSSMLMDSVHLVENEGELMLVDRKQNGNNNREYKVYRMDLDAKKMVPVRGLSGRAVFIGRELAVSVSPFVFPSIDADSIYLGCEHSMTCVLDNSPIHLMDGTSYPREFENNIGDMPLHGPLGIDDYLSCYVIGYRNPLNDT